MGGIDGRTVTHIRHIADMWVGVSKLCRRHDGRENTTADRKYVKPCCVIVVWSDNNDLLGVELRSHCVSLKITGFRSSESKKGSDDRHSACAAGKR